MYDLIEKDFGKKITIYNVSLGLIKMINTVNAAYECESDKIYKYRGIPEMQEKILRRILRLKRKEIIEFPIEDWHKVGGFNSITFLEYPDI